MSFDAQQELLLQVFASISGACSACGSGYVIWKIAAASPEERASLSSRMLLVLSLMDFFGACFFGVGIAGSRNDAFCVVQGFMIEWFALGGVVWNSCMAWNIYKWIVLRKHPDRIIRKLKYYIAASVLIPFTISVALAIEGVFGFANLWCWIQGGEEILRFYLFYFIVIICWVYNTVMFVRISYEIRSRVQTITATAGTSALANAHSLVERKLISYIAVFVFTWFFGLLNRTIQEIQGAQFWAALLHVMIVPAQGIMNAVIYGGLFEEDSEVMKWWTKCACCWGFQPLNQQSNNEKSSIEAVRTGRDRHARSSNTGERSRFKMFLTTYNLGEATIEAVGDISAWLPLGYDLYAIGVQECLCLEELRAAIHRYLGGPTQYTAFSNEIGSTNTTLGYHGYIALTVFVRSKFIETGVVRLTETAQKDVKKGMNLVVARASNKGSVGLPFRIYDQSVAFLTAHFASDSKGKSRKVQRNVDAREMLQEIVLQPEDVGCDLHLQHDHVFVVGDLNYRMDADPRDLLPMFAAVASAELQTHGKGWLQDRYDRMLSGQSIPARTSTAGLAAEQSLAARWQKILQLDELLQEKNARNIFHSFQEMPIYFPPTYRRKRGPEGFAGDFTDLEVLYQAYVTNVDGDSVEVKGTRPPSYTDRILYHSLPDEAHLIRPSAYEMCELMIGSDHKPVSMACDLLVQDDGKSLADPNSYEHLGYYSLWISALSADVSSLGATMPAPVDEIAPPSTFRVTQAGDEEDDGGDRRTMQTIQLETNPLTTTDAFENPITDTTISSVKIVFPLPTEDPLTIQRKVHDVAKALGLTQVARANKAQMESLFKDLPHSASFSNTNVDSFMSLVSVYRWYEAASSELQLVSVATPELGVHALLKLTNAAGDCLGQAVVPLAGLIDSETPQYIEVPLTSGGRYTGELRGMFRLTFLQQLRSTIDEKSSMV